MLNYQGWPIFRIALLSLGLLWLAFPPVGWAGLAWFAWVPLFLLVVQRDLTVAVDVTVSDKHAASPEFRHARGPKRMYWKLYFAGFLYWLGTFYFIPIPHPALYGGWILVSAYMAVYTPMLIGVSRTLVHRFRVPPIIVIPIVITGIEWIRCHFATGMGMVCLSHSQYKAPLIIQLADISGAYTVTFAMTFVATGLACFVHPFIAARIQFRQNPTDSPSRVHTSKAKHVLPLSLAIAMLCGIAIYGSWRMRQIEIRPESNKDDFIKIALIQSSFDFVLEPTSEEKFRTRWDQVRELTINSLSFDPDIVVWPEGTFPIYADCLSDGPYGTVAEVQENLRDIVGYATGGVSQSRSPFVLSGILTRDPQAKRAFNAAVLFDRNGLIQKRYFKRHLVMFGEYVPLADQVPLIHWLSPMGRNLNVGDSFESVQVQTGRLAPSICFETTVPHLIREQINTLESDGKPISAMVNLTNDGWFFGTSCLDLHLACNVFRAVEMRRSHLVCANTGLSAQIDPAGRLLQVTQRRTPDVLLCEVGPNDGGVVGKSIYRSLGDVFPRIFGYITLIVLAWNAWMGFGKKSTSE